MSSLVEIQNKNGEFFRLLRKKNLNDKKYYLYPGLSASFEDKKDECSQNY